MKKTLKLILFSLCLLLLLYVVTGFAVSRLYLKLTEYEISNSKLTEPVRIVQIADLHCAKFGKRLLRNISDQEPDLIFVIGDLVDRNKAEIAPALNTLEALVSIAPVYVSMGNHDDEHNLRFQDDLAEQYRQTGATVLDKDYVDIDIRGQALRIGGIYGYCLPANLAEAREAESQFLTEFQDTSRYTILLAHMPVCWLINGSLDYWEIDCVLSGHTHGGQVILPVIGGLYAPDQGWIPGECSGHFQSDGKHLLITTGLGGTTPVPRFYNPSEIVSLTLSP